MTWPRNNKESLVPKGRTYFILSRRERDNCSCQTRDSNVYSCINDDDVCSNGPNYCRHRGVYSIIPGPNTRKHTDENSDPYYGYEKTNPRPLKSSFDEEVLNDHTSKFDIVIEVTGAASKNDMTSSGSETDDGSAQTETDTVVTTSDDYKIVHNKSEPHKCERDNSTETDKLEANGSGDNVAVICLNGDVSDTCNIKENTEESSDGKADETLKKEARSDTPRICSNDCIYAHLNYRSMEARRQGSKDKRHCCPTTNQESLSLQVSK